MKNGLFVLALVVVMAGCAGDPAPTVGDAEISKGIQRKPMPKPPQGLASSGLSSKDLAGIRQGKGR
jgi:hypothetical protein